MLPPSLRQDLSKADPPPVILGYTPAAVALRHVHPTWRNYIMYVDLEARAGNLDAARYLAAYDALPYSERRGHMPEQICDLASVSVADLMSWVTRQAWMEKSCRVSLLLSFLSDEVLESAGKFAIESAANHVHTKLFLQAGGVLPAPGPGGGGRSVQIFNAPIATSGSVALANSKSESGPVDRSGLRDMDSEIVELSRIMQTDAPGKCAAELVPDDPVEEHDDSEEDEDED